MKKAVIICCFGWYERRLYYVYEKLRNEGYDITYLVSDYEHINKVVRTDDYEGKLTLLHVPQYKNNISMKRIYSHYYFSVTCENQLNTINPDIIYAVIPPNSTGNVVYKYKMRHSQCQLIIDIVDLWPESFPLGFLKKTPLYPLWRRIRTQAISVADLVILECDFYREILLSITNRKYETLRLMKKQNIKAREIVNSGLAKYSFDRDIITFCYLGSINNIVDIDSIHNIIKALSAKGKTVVLKVIGKGTTKDKLMSVAKEAGSKVIDYGSVFDDDVKTKIMIECDFGLNMMIDSVRVGLTLKSIDYFSAGLPIINNIKGDTWKYVKDNQAGFNYNGNDEELIEWINTFEPSRRIAVYHMFETSFEKRAFEKEFEEILERYKIV